MSEKMSFNELYWVAATAKSKLRKAASRTEHNLRLLVGHANLLDDLMEELHDIKRQDDSCAAFGIHLPIDDCSDNVEEFVWDGSADDDSDDDSDDISDDDLDDEPPEPQDEENGGLSLIRWPSHPPAFIELIQTTKSKSEVRVNGISPQQEPQQSRLAFNRIVDDGINDVMKLLELKVTQSTNELVSADASNESVLESNVLSNASRVTHNPHGEEINLKMLHQ